MKKNEIQEEYIEIPIRKIDPLSNFSGDYDESLRVPKLSLKTGFSRTLLSANTGLKIMRKKMRIGATMTRVYVGDFVDSINPLTKWTLGALCRRSHRLELMDDTQHRACTIEALYKLKALIKSMKTYDEAEIARFLEEHKLPEEKELSEEEQALKNVRKAALPFRGRLF